MGGSKRGKRSNGKGKSKSKTSDVSNQKPEGSNHSLCLTQTSENYNDRPDSSEEDRHWCSSASCRLNYTDEEIEGLLYTKVEDLYAEARICLSTMGYSENDIENAMLRNGYTTGQTKDILNNLVTNTMAYLEGNYDRKKGGLKGFGSMMELHERCVERMIDFAIKQAGPNMTRAGAVWLLLLTDWGFVPPVSLTSGPNSIVPNVSANVVLLDPSSSSQKVASEDADSSWKKIPINKLINEVPDLKLLLKQRVPTLAAYMRHKFPIIDEQVYQTGTSEVTEPSEYADPELLEHITSPSFDEFIKGLIERDCSNPKITMIHELVKSIRDAQQKVTRQKEWAQEILILSAKTVSKHLLEMSMLRIQGDKNKKEQEKNRAICSYSWRLIEKEHALHAASLELDACRESVRDWENEVAELETLKLHLAITEKDLKESQNRQRRWCKKAKEHEEECGRLQSQCDEEEKRVRQLQLELLQTEKDAKDAEMLWRQAKKEKEQMSAGVAEEFELVKIQKASSREKLLKLRQKIQIDSQLLEDERRRLEDELSSLHLSSEMPDMSPADADNLYDIPEAVSFTLRASLESSSNRNCIICMKDQVSMVFLPCTHQVVCYRCYEGGRIGKLCPYCRVDIEEAFKVYGSSS